ncbi:MAG: hypothetical protein ACKVZJ_12150 [Phycisphaerales bacterium]
MILNIALAGAAACGLAGVCRADPGASGVVPTGGPLVWEETYPIARRDGQTFAVDPATGHILMFGGGVGAFSPGGDTQLGDLWRWDGVSWSNLNVAGPAPRTRAAAAFNPATGRMMLFGGNGSPPNFALASGSIPWARNDTWEWTGTRWHQLQAEGPTPTGSSAGDSMAYDAARAEMVLTIAGVNSSTESTWAWDGTKWQQRQVGGTDRRRTRMAFDADTQRLVVIRSNAFTGPFVTEEWTGTEWVVAAAPEPAWTGEMTTLADVTTGRAFALGSTATQPLGLWERVDGVWTRLFDVPARPISGFEPVWDAANNTLLAMGSFSPRFMSHKTYLLRNGAWQAVVNAGPDARVRPSVTHDPVRNVTVVYGTSISRNFNDIPSDSRPETWEFDGVAWALKGTASQVRPPASFLSAFYDAAAGVHAAALLGRSDRPTWQWNGTSWSERVTNTPPPRRNGASGAYHAGIGAYVAFGGVAPSGSGPIDNSTWLLQGPTWTELAISGPSPRQFPFMVYDEHRQKIVLFGGTPPGSFDNLSETWEFDGTAWTQTALGSSPPIFAEGTVSFPRIYLSMTYDAVRRKTVLLEGPALPGATTSIPPNSFTTRPGNIWEYDGQSWTQRTAAQPVRPMESWRIAISFWGNSNPLRYLARRLALTPGFTTESTLAFDPSSGRCLMWGGENLVLETFYGPLSVAPASLRELPESAVLAHPCSRLIGVAGRAIFIEGRIAMDHATYRWFKDGVELAASPRVLGEAAEGLIIRDLRLSDAGLYTLVATGAGGETLGTLACELRVRSRADFNDDGKVDTKDLTRFLMDFGTSDTRCRSTTYDLHTGCLEDLNADGVTDTRDLVAFLGEMARAGAM